MRHLLLICLFLVPTTMLTAGDDSAAGDRHARVREYLRDHPEAREKLKEWITAHPEAREKLKERIRERVEQHPEARERLRERRQQQ